MKTEKENSMENDTYFNTKCQLTDKCYFVSKIVLRKNAVYCVNHLGISQNKVVKIHQKILLRLTDL